VDDPSQRLGIKHFTDLGVQVLGEILEGSSGGNGHGGWLQGFGVELPPPDLTSLEVEECRGNTVEQGFGLHFAIPSVNYFTSSPSKIWSMDGLINVFALLFM